jgi:hypothetical protein
MFSFLFFPPKLFLKLIYKMDFEKKKKNLFKKARNLLVLSDGFSSHPPSLFSPPSAEIFWKIHDRYIKKYYMIWRAEKNLHPIEYFLYILV